MINKFSNIIFFSLIFLGIYLSYIGGYGSDEDTLAMINSFETILFSGDIIVRGSQGILLLNL